MTELTTVRPNISTTTDLVPAPGGATLITEHQVRFSTAAALAIPPVRTSRFSAVAKAMSGLFTAPHQPTPRYRAKRYVYLENALMAREMDRL